MPIPKPPMSDGDTKARMQRALSAWRQIAEVVRGVSRAAQGKQDSLASSILNDLEAVANAFDAWPSAWAHIEDLRAEIERLERSRLPESGSFGRCASCGGPCNPLETDCEACAMSARAAL